MVLLNFDVAVDEQPLPVIQKIRIMIIVEITTGNNNNKCLDDPPKAIIQEKDRVVILMKMLEVVVVSMVQIILNNIKGKIIKQHLQDINMLLVS